MENFQQVSSAVQLQEPQISHFISNLHAFSLIE